MALPLLPLASGAFIAAIFFSKYLKLAGQAIGIVPEPSLPSPPILRAPPAPQTPEGMTAWTPTMMFEVRAHEQQLFVPQSAPPLIEHTTDNRWLMLIGAALIGGLGIGILVRR